MNKGRVLIIVPSFREEKNIFHVISGLRVHVPHLDILIIDDGSKDRTQEIAADNGVKVLKHPFNMGYGVAVQTGYKYAVKHDYDIVVQIDGDGQHDPKFITPLIRTLQQSRADVVIGSRFLKGGGYDAPFIRKAGIKFFSKIASVITKQKFTDSTSGQQALSRRVFTYFSELDNFPYDYPDADTIITLCFAGFKIKEIPVHMHDRMKGKSMISGIRVIIYVIQMLISIFIILIRKRKIANGYIQSSINTRPEVKKSVTKLKIKHKIKPKIKSKHRLLHPRVSLN
ncbi:MAG: glycosyltransferase family 2 protein [Candidatus Scalindua sp.]|nr:glycosyltransferase family 2 protein [Candidatus Scalindua sp.]